MLPTFDVNEIAEMTDEQKARNTVRQIRHEVNVWNRPLSYRGQPVIRWQDLPRGIKLLCGGFRGRQWCQVISDGAPIGPRFKMFGAAEESSRLYAFIMECADKIECAEAVDEIRAVEADPELCESVQAVCAAAGCRW